MWLHNREYIACLAQCTRYHYGWVPYGQANVASYQHLIQIASCSFNEVAIQLGGVFPSDWKNKSGTHTYVWCTENIHSMAYTCYRFYTVCIARTHTQQMCTWVTNPPTNRSWINQSSCLMLRRACQLLCKALQHTFTHNTLLCIDLRDIYVYPQSHIMPALVRLALSHIYTHTLHLCRHYYQPTRHLNIEKKSHISKTVQTFILFTPTKHII